MSDHIETRRKLKSIYDVRTFEDLLECCVLTDEEKELLKLYYLRGKDLGYIADMLGYSESTIKRKHQKALTKIHKLI